MHQIKGLKKERWQGEWTVSKEKVSGANQWVKRVVEGEKKKI